MRAKDVKIAGLEDEKAAISADFGLQLTTVRDEFARMSEIAVKDQEELNQKIANLEQELHEAYLKGETNDAGAALE